jgi:hypothetical protein
MSFRDDGDALRSRVDALEDELARSKDEADRLRGQLAAQPQTSAAAAHGFTRGAGVWIEWRGTWWRGTVLEPLGGDAYRVHYTGWSSIWDEVVSRARLAPIEQRPPGREAPSGTKSIAAFALVLVVAVAGILIAVRSTPRSAPPAGAAPITTVTSVLAAEPVWVEWNGVWYEGTVISGDAATGLVHIHYEGYESSFDEDVSLVRLRERR